ncbi:MAG TPA: terminase small subunit [Nitrospiraceae bacterium]|nr:terminase small subunit [Nitrospiraceae bacterium]
MQLNRAELAKAFRVSLNTINAWVIRGLPMQSPGGRGVASRFVWKDVERWAYMYKTWPGHAEPDYVIGAAYWRAIDIVKLRNKRSKRNTRP